jgi:uncharacterized protein with PIN domain
MAAAIPIASRRFDDLLREAQIVIDPVTDAQARIARDAYRDFGKGSRHPAQLTLATASPTRSPKSLICAESAT